MSAIDDLTSELARLPGIGRKTALRLTYHLLKQPPEQSRRLASALQTLSEKIRPCSRCFNLTEEELCAICRDPRRDATLVCVVEDAADIGAIERAGDVLDAFDTIPLGVLRGKAVARRPWPVRATLRTLIYQCLEAILDEPEQRLAV